MRVEPARDPKFTLAELPVSRTRCEMTSQSDNEGRTGARSLPKDGTKASAIELRLGSPKDVMIQTRRAQLGAQAATCRSCRARTRCRRGRRLGLRCNRRGRHRLGWRPERRREQAWPVVVAAVRRQPGGAPQARLGASARSPDAEHESRSKGSRRSSARARATGQPRAPTTHARHAPRSRCSPRLCRRAPRVLGNR